MDRQTETDGRGVPGGLQDAGLSHCWGLGLQLGAPVCAPPPNPLHPHPPHPGASIYSVTLFLYWEGSHKCPHPPLHHSPPSQSCYSPPCVPPLQSTPCQWGGGPWAHGGGHRILSVAPGWCCGVRLRMGHMVGGGGMFSMGPLLLLKPVVGVWGGCGAVHAACVGQLQLYPPHTPS